MSRRSFPRGFRFISSPLGWEVEVPGFPQSKQPGRDDGFPLRYARELPLWKRLRAWCQYVGWYGPDHYIESVNASVDIDGNLLTARPLARVEQRFEYPVATEEEIRRAEERMGYAHPPLLRDLYLHLANGGFGPGRGLTGIPQGGYGWWARLDPRYEDHPFDRIGLSERSLFDLSLSQEQYSFADPLLIGEREWPQHMIHLCSYHQEENSYLHLPGGRIYRAEGGYGGLMPNGEVLGASLHLEADSLGEWLERWLEGDDPTSGEKEGLQNWQTSDRGSSLQDASPDEGWMTGFPG